MNRLLVLLLIVACGADEETPEPTEEPTVDPECQQHAASFWSDVEQISQPVVPDHPPITAPVRAAEPAELSLDHDSFRYVHIVIDPEMVTLEGHRLAPTEIIADGSGAPVSLSTQIARMAESGNPIRVLVHADGSVAAGALMSVISGIGEHAEVSVLAYRDDAGENPRGIPDAAEMTRIGALEGEAREQAVQAAATSATESCPDLRDAVAAMMRAVLPSDGARARLGAGHFSTSIEEKIVECGCQVDLDQLLGWYRASALNRWGQLGVVEVEAPSNAREWADKTIDDVIS